MRLPFANFWRELLWLQIEWHVERLLACVPMDTKQGQDLHAFLIVWMDTQKQLVATSAKVRRR